MKVGTIIMLDNKRLALVINKTQGVLSDGSKITLPKEPIVFIEAGKIIEQFEEVLLQCK